MNGGKKPRRPLDNFDSTVDDQARVEKPGGSPEGDPSVDLTLSGLIEVNWGKASLAAVPGVDSELNSSTLEGWNGDTRPSDVIKVSADRMEKFKLLRHGADLEVIRTDVESAVNFISRSKSIPQSERVIANNLAVLLTEIDKYNELKIDEPLLENLPRELVFRMSMKSWGFTLKVLVKFEIVELDDSKCALVVGRGQKDKTVAICERVLSAAVAESSEVKS